MNPVRAAVRAPGRGLRDRRFGEAVSVYLVDLPVAEQADALVAAYGELVRTNARGVGALAWPSGRWLTTASALDAAADASVHHLPGRSDLDAVRAVVARGPGPLATSLTLLDGVVALSVEHGAADGNEAVALLLQLLDSVAGIAPQPLGSAIGLPLLRAVAGSGPRPFVRYLRHRRGFAVPPPATLHPRGDAADRSALVRLPLSGAELRALRADALGASTGAVLISVMAEALREGHRGTRDPRVVIPIDVRRRAGSGMIPGNFIATETAGALLADAWDPRSVAGVLLRQVEIAVPQLLVGTLRPLRPARRRAGPAAPELYVSLSVQRAAVRGAPDGAAPRLGIASVGRTWPSAALAAAFVHDDGASLSFWDDSGAFDLEAVAAAVQRRVAVGGTVPSAGHE